MFDKDESQIFREIAASAAKRFEVFEDLPRLRHSCSISCYLEGDILVAIVQETFGIEVVSHVDHDILQAVGIIRNRDLEIERLRKTLLVGDRVLEIQIVGKIV